MKRNSVMVLCAAALASCQGAYNTSTGPAQPQLDIHKNKKVESEISPITSGGILMRRTDDAAWEAPKREVDAVRDELASLKQSLGSLYTAQERRLASKFDEVESRVAEMRQQEMKEASQDAELLALVKEKFDIIDTNIDYLKANDATGQQQQQTLLDVLDQKFSRVEERMTQVDIANQDVISAQRQEIKTVLEDLEMETLRRTSNLEQEIVSMQQEKERLLSALDQKFTQVEESNLSLSDALTSQSVQEEKRRAELLNIVQSTEKVKTEYAVEAEKQKAILEQKMIALKDRLRSLEAEDLEREAKSEGRRLTMQKEMEKRLVALEEEYGRKISAVESQRAILDGKLAALNEKTVVNLMDENKKAQARLAEIRGKESVYREDLIAAEAATAELQKSIETQDKERKRLQSSLLLDRGLTKEQRAELEVEMKELERTIADERVALGERVAKQNAFKTKLNELKNRFQPEITKLLAKSENLAKRLKDADADTVVALQEERNTLSQNIAGLSAEHEIAIADAQTYRTALEERSHGLERGRAVAKKSKTDELAAFTSPALESADIVSSIHTPVAIKSTAGEKGGMIAGYTSDKWIPLKDYKVVVHEDERRLKDIVINAVRRAEPFVGPWEVKWKLKAENADVIHEKFSLDVEATFDAFAAYLSSYMKGYRGFNLTFNMFNEERVLVITDDRF